MQTTVILVVEDNQDELMIYATLLGYHGYAVLTAADYDSAFAIARQHRPDLAVIDVNLNDPMRRDGCDLVQALREAPETKDMPVIAHTAFGDVYAQRLERIGCEKVIHKPSNPRLLLDAIEELLGTAGADAGAEAKVE